MFVCSLASQSRGFPVTILHPRMSVVWTFTAGRYYVEML